MQTHAQFTTCYSEILPELNDIIAIIVAAVIKKQTRCCMRRRKIAGLKCKTGPPLIWQTLNSVIQFRQSVCGHDMSFFQVVCLHLTHHESRGSDFQDCHHSQNLVKNCFFSSVEKMLITFYYYPLMLAKLSLKMLAQGFQGWSKFSDAFEYSTIFSLPAWQILQDKVSYFLVSFMAFKAIIMACIQETWDIKSRDYLHFC